MSSTSERPILIECGSHVDRRGILNYCNAFDFKTIKRFYEIVHDTPNTKRGMHGHLLEGKYFYVTHGMFEITAIPLTTFEKSSPCLTISDGKKFCLSEHRPKILYIPPGYANGLFNLTPIAKVMIFSTLTVAESKTDDYRFGFIDIFHEYS
ncbi:MAG: hypothetical protein EKK57_05080 [Proteobacteria bacterium]|nr:MAG: hypothetical protein EKK57_05080 [Pseudomonadota bacterium]